MKERIHDFAVQTNFQSLLHDNLIALMKMTITLQSQKLLHDLDYLQDHIESRAVSSVEEELIILKNKLQYLSENEADAT